MTRLEALEELVAKVEAGYLTFPEAQAWGHHGTGRPGDLWPAFRGSLDAAQSLHEAVLPDEGWEVWRTAKYPGMIPGSSPYAFKAKVGWGTTHIGAAGTPARAWLIAILRALIAIEKGEG